MVDSRGTLVSGWRRQLAVFTGAYVLYGAGRFAATGDHADAVDHAQLLVAAERELGIAIERSVQGALQGSTWLWLLNHLYLAAQLVAVPATLVWLYRTAPAGYLRLRNVVVGTWLLAVPIHALFPVAPPRLADPAMVDTITTQTGIALDSKLTTAFYNPLAAVPSLHSGFAIAVGVAIALYARPLPARLLGPLWPLLIVIAVVATGNHFLLDVAAGAAVSAAALALTLGAERLARRPPAGRPSGLRRELPAEASA